MDGSRGRREVEFEGLGEVSVEKLLASEVEEIHIHSWHHMNMTGPLYSCTHISYGCLYKTCMGSSQSIFQKGVGEGIMKSFGQLMASRGGRIGFLEWLWVLVG